MPRRGWILLLILSGSLRCFAAPRNIILITLDTTRADRMGFLGSKAGLTPNLDKLASQSTVFTHAFSQVPLTTASHATILSGTYPQFHHVNDAGVPLPRTVPFAPAIFRARGYQTAAFVGAVILDPHAGAPGFDRGFDTYDAGFRSRNPGESRYATLERRGAEVVARATAWVSKHDGKPFFLWVHLYDPHAPYDPPEPFRSRFTDPYDGEIAYTDSAVGTLLDALKAAHAYDNSVIALMADHGEAFGEHGELGHGVFLYAPTIHVPLVIKLAATDAGKRVETRVSLVDVLPTLLESTGIAAPAAMQGKSLLPLVQPSKPEPDRVSYAETDYPHRAYGWSSLRSTRSGKYLFIEAPHKELYDETADPAEDHNLAASATAVTSTLQSQLDRFRARTATSPSAATANLTPAQEQSLRALGYVAGSGSTAKGSEVGGIDPKDKIALANGILQANLALEDGHSQEAISELRRVVAQDPNFAAAYSVLGSALSDSGNYRDAIPVLRKAVELHPESVGSRYNLALSLFQVGDLTDAATQMEAAVKADPESATMHYSLASVYVRINRFDDAQKQLQQALVLRPNDFDSNLMLGQVFIVKKSPAAALPYLQKAEKLQPGSAQVHQLLADTYTQLGRKADADRERSPRR